MMLIITFLLNVIVFVGLWFINSYIYGVASFLIALVFLGFIISKEETNYYKFSWALVIIVLPIFGLTLYAYLKVNKGSRKKRESWNNILYNSFNYVNDSEQVLKELSKLGDNQYKQSMYIRNTCYLPVYQNSASQYYKNGAEYFEALFAELKKAQKYIFIEYFIFEEGKIFSQLFEILKEKAREGVEVKIIYDDFGCLDRFEDKNTFKKLENFKIKAVPFNKISLHLNAFVNYRTHRKIVVIDGKVGFTGGINVADEYANIVNRFGDWKDCGIKLTGECVWALTTLFLNSWQFASKEVISDYTPYIPLDLPKLKSKEFVQIFGTSPLTKGQSAKNIYLNMINNAQKSILITTPYFITDAEMSNALKIASRSGVNVTIIVPGTPDKKIPYYMARSRFSELIKENVKIYEYKPGFIHSKLLVVDDESAIIGTINMDFRSLYLHFENGVLLQNSATVKAISDDINNTIKQSRLITIKDMKNRKAGEKFIAKLLQFLEPLM